MGSIKKIQFFFAEEIWQIDTSQLSFFKKLWIRCLRVFILVLRSFRKSQIQQGASALTYYSLLAVVPVVMLILGIARGFLLEDDLKTLLLSKFTVQEEAVTLLINLAEGALKAIHQGFIIGMGTLLLIWSSINILNYIEIVMNSIWNVKRERSMAKRFSDYLALIFICPIIAVVASSLTFYVSARLSAIHHQQFLFEELGTIVFAILNLIPYLLTGALFTFLYIFIPNTTVRFLPALYAGMITGVIYQILQWAYLYFQFGVSSANQIYGTFAAFPLFLIWLNISWMIFLLGAKMCFAFQNVHAYEFISENFQLSQNYRQILYLRIIHFIIRRFCKRESPPTKIEVSNYLSIPLALTLELLFELTDGKILSEVIIQNDEEVAYQPALDVNQLTIQKALEMMDQRGNKIPLPQTPDVAAIVKQLTEFRSLIEHSEANKLLKDL